MMKKLSVLAFTAALLLPTANAQAATVAIGGSFLPLVYDPATSTLCDVNGCGFFQGSGDLSDAAKITALAFSVDNAIVGLLADAPAFGNTESYVDVALTLGAFVNVGGGTWIAPILAGGVIDFHTFGDNGADYLQLDVTGGNVVYGLAGTSVNASTSNALFQQELSYSFGNFVFSDPDIAWSYSSPSSTGSLAGGFTTNAGTPDWSDDTVEFDTPVPEPGSMLLLGSGLMGLAASARRRLRRKDQ